MYYAMYGTSDESNYLRAENAMLLSLLTSLTPGSVPTDFGLVTTGSAVGGGGGGESSAGAAAAGGPTSRHAPMRGILDGWRSGGGFIFREPETADATRTPGSAPVPSRRPHTADGSGARSSSTFQQPLRRHHIVLRNIVNPAGGPSSAATMQQQPPDHPGRPPDLPSQPQNDPAQTPDLPAQQPPSSPVHLRRSFSVPPQSQLPSGFVESLMMGLPLLSFMDGFSGVAEADEYARLLGLGATAGRMVRHVANVDAAAPRRSLAPGEPPVQQGGFCVICMDSFDEVLRRDAITDRGIRETLCGHTFCSPCIEKWLADSVSCPVCMRDLSPEGGLAIRDEPGTAAPTPDRAASEYRASSTLGSGAYDRGNGGGWRGGAGTSPSHAFGAMHTPVIVDFGTGAGPQLASAEELAGVLRARRHRLEFLTALGSGLFDDDRGSDARRSDGREDRERTGDVGRALRFLSHEGNRRRAAERQQRVSPELGGYRVYEAGGGLPAEAARGPCPHARPEGGTSPLSDRGDPLHVARAVYHFDQVARMFDTLAASAEAVRRL